MTKLFSLRRFYSLRAYQSLFDDSQMMDMKILKKKQANRSQPQNRESAAKNREETFRNHVECLTLQVGTGQ